MRFLFQRNRFLHLSRDLTDDFGYLNSTDLVSDIGEKPRRKTLKVNKDFENKKAEDNVTQHNNLDTRALDNLDQKEDSVSNSINNQNSQDDYHQQHERMNNFNSRRRNSYDNYQDEERDEYHRYNSYDDSQYFDNLSDSLKHIEVSDLNMKSIKELREMADIYKVDISASTQKQHLINSILRKVVFIPQIILTFDGVLEVLEDNGGFGFLRSRKMDYSPSNNDVYVPSHIIRKYNLETGHSIYCTIKQQNNKKGEKYYPIDRILKINGLDVDDSDVVQRVKDRRHFDELTPCYPNSQYKLEGGKGADYDNLTNRIVDIMSPIGKGQRALIVAPPRTGKTVLLKNIANSISAKYPKTKLFVLLIDERPEEVTDMINSIKSAEVVSSTFDQSAESHVHLAEIVLEKAKRLVECGEDVVIILDSITRLARAYNTTAPSSGKVLTGGIDSGALQRPKRWFGAARNISSGGSLTIIASALVETGSRMDEVIFEEFKGTGNCEIVLDRRISEKRIFPAFDMLKSGTRKEELLLSPNELQRIWLLRRVLSSLSANEAIELLREKILATKTNEEFLNNMGNSGQ
jgi:transcription termination factor Rho